MKKSILLPIFALAAFFGLTGLTISIGLENNVAGASQVLGSGYFYVYPDDNFLNGKDGDDNYILDDEDDGVAVINVKYLASSGWTDGAIALGMDVNDEAKAKLANCISFRYKYKGPFHAFRATVSNLVAQDAGHDHEKEFIAATNWVTANVAFADLKQPDWAPQVTFNIANIAKFAWIISDEDATIAGEFLIKDFECTEAIEPSGNGYKIFAYDITNTTTGSIGADSKTAWGTDASAYVYPKLGDEDYNASNHPTFQNPINPHYPSELTVDEGVLKLKGVNLGTAPGSNNYYPGAFLGINTLSTGENGEKITDCEEGFSYWYKGTAHWFLLEFDGRVCKPSGSVYGDGSNKWGIKVTSASTSDWTKKVVPLNDFSITNTWTGAECTSANSTVQLDKIQQMVWGFDDKQTGTNLMIADIACLTTSGNTYVSSKPDNSISVNTGYFGGSSSSGGGSQTQSSSSGGSDGGSSSSSGGTPIISYNNAPITGLNVVSFANNLRIASGKDATVYLFDLRGKQVFSQRVLSGTTTISLKSQKQGIYYAVVKSGSQKKVVKVVLK